MPTAPSVCVRAPTTIANLGYGLDVFAMAVDVGYDSVEIRAGGNVASGISLSVGGPFGAGISSEPSDNTAGRALQALREAHGLRDAILVRLEKGTRPGSGLGSSAASAAAAVVAANEYYGLDLSRERLVQFAAEGERVAAGAPITDNVSGSIFGGFVVFSTDAAPQVRHLAPPERLRMVVALPDVHIKTADARQVLPKEISIRESCRGAARAALAALALAEGDVAAFGRAIEGSIYEQCRATLIPGCGAVFAAARQAGAMGVTICGAGPAIGAVAEHTGDLKGIAAAMRAAFRDAGLACQTFEASPAGGAHVVKG